MRPLTSLITAAAFLLHLGLGCGAHHEHGATRILCTQSVAPIKAPCHHGHSHEDERSSPDSDAPEHPGESHDDCHETHCTFLVTGKTTVLPDTLVTALPSIVLDAAVTRTASSSVNWMRDTGDHLHLPVRLHLFNQVLLI